MHMNTIPIHVVNLDLAPEERWTFLADYKSEMEALFDCYLNDIISGIDQLKHLQGFEFQLIPESYLKEIEGIASMINFSPYEVLIANLYYDILKFYFGCSAFAYHNGERMFHARNLDWHTENNLLSDHSMIFEFQKEGKTIFQSVGWPGFIGVLSGNRPNSFSITLNAVLSEDPVELATPISFFIRDVLTEASTYKEAVNRLTNETLMSDSLLLISGIQTNEMCVIERTPKRFAVRKASSNFIAVTNDYKVLSNAFSEHNNLQSTSCGRYDAVVNYLSKKKVSNVQDCWDILQDGNVMMGITVQQMVFENPTGKIHLIKT